METLAYRDIKDGLLRIGGRGIRIDGRPAGIPDIHYIIRGCAGWIEAKDVERWVGPSNFGLQAEQAIWLHRYAENGGACYIWVRIKRRVVVFHGRDALRIRRKIAFGDIVPVYDGYDFPFLTLEQRNGEERRNAASGEAKAEESDKRQSKLVQGDVLAEPTRALEKGGVRHRAGENTHADRHSNPGRHHAGQAPKGVDQGSRRRGPARPCMGASKANSGDRR